MQSILGDENKKHGDVQVSMASRGGSITGSGARLLPLLPSLLCSPRNP